MTLRDSHPLVGTAILTVAFTAASLTLHGFALTFLGNVVPLVLMALTLGYMVANAISETGQTSVFWWLMATGAGLWTVNQFLWSVYELVLRRDLPDPFYGDVILFIHLVPFMAAMALRPHRPAEGHKLYLGTLNFLMLLLWWVFLYTFIVVPDEYVVLNLPVFNRNYEALYLVENLLLVAALIALAARTRGNWKPIYWNLLLASALYALGSESMNWAIDVKRYRTGSLYDVPFLVSVYWMLWTVRLARRTRPTCEAPVPENPRWIRMAPRLALLPVLSLPLIAAWTLFFDHAHPQLRQFRLITTLVAMLLLSAFVLARQYLQDRELVRLLHESHRSFENLERLQTDLVQKEKLASLGELVAGAAHEINNPLAAILGYSELLASNSDLSETQESMARKITHQARRARDLVAGLLSFAQQTPAEKSLVDVGLIAQRVVQMEALRLEARNIRVQFRVAPGLPPVWGNNQQLFQCCVHIVGNAMDALEETGGGTLQVAVEGTSEQVQLTFSDSGPGIREPKRVFDPFYTTKAIGQGTGLGLSAAYGIVQEHHGRIVCYNRPEGGATFQVRLAALPREKAEQTPTSPSAGIESGA